MSKEKNYEEILGKIIDYEQAIHEKNQKRIKIGLKLFLFVPLCFLFLLFWTGSNKVVFLILWIVSLFVLSIYLIVVEFLDYDLQEKLMEIKGEKGEIETLSPADFDRAARIIQSTKEILEQNLNSKDETERALEEGSKDTEETSEAAKEE